MLILFDVDGTLLLTKGAGILAMRDAGREIFGEHFDHEGVAFSGRLDPLIWRDLAGCNGIDDPDAHHDVFRAGYRRHLARRLERDATAFALPGVANLLEALTGHDAITTGLLTGNYPETGRLKMNAAGIDPDQFSIFAWGIDGATRRDLPPHAIRQYESLSGSAIERDRVVIIGDTPHDVDCAHHHGCRVLAVTTGAFSADQLHEAGADMVMDDLSDTATVVDWLVNGRPTISK